MSTTEAPTVLTLVRHFDAPPELVFRAWTEPEHLGWFFNPGMTPNGPPTVDLRVGGAWRQHMVVNAETEYMTGGIYREIVPGRKLVFAWGAVDGWPPLDPARLDEAPEATILFEPDGEGTRMTFRFVVPAEFAEALPRPLMEAGWTMTIDRLVADLAAG